jgi:hypothetical protein
VTATKNKSAKTIGFATFASAPPTFNQALLSFDKREGAKIPNNSNRVPAAKIKDTTKGIVPAANIFAAPLTIKMLPTVDPNARSPPASAGSSSQ